MGPVHGRPWQRITGTRSLLHVWPPPPSDLRIEGVAEGVGVLGGSGGEDAAGAGH